MKAFPRWLGEVRKHEDILARMQRINDKGFAGYISFKQMISKIGDEGEDHWELPIPCPFLTGNVCSIYDMRPFVCANLFSTMQCDVSDAAKAETQWLALPPTIELPFWDDRIEVIYQDIIPQMVFRLLISGIQFLSEVPGLTSMWKECLTDHEVK